MNVLPFPPSNRLSPCLSSIHTNLHTCDLKNREGAIDIEREREREREKERVKNKKKREGERERMRERETNRGKERKGDIEKFRDE